MMRFFKRLFGHQEPPPFDIEKAVGRYLMNLPPCAARLVVISPKYGDLNYRCDVVVGVDDLLPWAERHAKGVWSSNPEEQAARQALPIWLRAANRNDSAPSYILPSFVSVVRPYVLDFVNKGFATIVCPDCKRVVDNIDMKKLNEESLGPTSRWTDEWYCPNGHLLYQEDHELRFIVRRQETP